MTEFEKRVLSISFLAGLLAALLVGCGTRPEPVALVDGPVRQVRRGEILDPSGDTVPLSAVEGWYVLAPRRLERILLGEHRPR